MADNGARCIQCTWIGSSYLRWLALVWSPALFKPHLLAICISCFDCQVRHLSSLWMSYMEMAANFRKEKPIHLLSFVDYLGEGLPLICQSVLLLLLLQYIHFYFCWQGQLDKPRVGQLIKTLQLLMQMMSYSLAVSGATHWDRTLHNSMASFVCRVVVLLMPPFLSSFSWCRFLTALIIRQTTQPHPTIK